MSGETVFRLLVVRAEYLDDEHLFSPETWADLESGRAHLYSLELNLPTMKEKQGCHPLPGWDQLLDRWDEFLGAWDPVARRDLVVLDHPYWQGLYCGHSMEQWGPGPDYNHIEELVNGMLVETGLG